MMMARFPGEDGNTQWAILKSLIQIGAQERFNWLRNVAPLLRGAALDEIAQDVLRHTPHG